MLPKAPTGSGWTKRRRPEEVMETVHDHIWDSVNNHFGTSAQSFPELSNNSASCALATDHGG
jgi:putative DNA methylase